MKKLILSISVLSLLLAAPLAAQKEEAQHKLVQFQMAIMKKGPKWTMTSEADGGKIMQQHVANVLSMYESGKMAIAGPFEDVTDIAGIFVMRTSSADEAKTWVDADPAVKAGLMVPEMHQWWSEDIFKKANSPLKLETVYLGFLKKGPNRKDDDDKNPEIQELQKAHLANIRRLAEMKKLLVAGPFGDDWGARGIFVLRVSSLQEAQELCATDPMVKSGRLTVELHPWQVPEGLLP